MNHEAAMSVDEVVEELAPQRRFRPYPEYRDSGVEAIGLVPSEWQVSQLKHTLLPKPGAVKTGPFGSQLLSSEMTGGSVKVYNQRTVLDRDFDAGDNYITEEKFKQLAGFAVFPYDVLVTTRGTIGRCAIVPADAERGILHPCVIRVQPDERRILREYLSRLIQDSLFVSAQLMILSNATTIEVVYSDSLKQVRLPLPPLNEQKAIAAFLERETARIDELIANKQRLIELLAEKRTALISHAVTKGLNPDAPMKESGIDWLGQVPGHWERQSIGQLCYMGRGKVMNNIYMQEHAGDFPVYSSQTDAAGVMGWIDSYMFEGEYLTWTTDGANAGTVFYRRGKFNCTNVCGTLKAIAEVELPYLQYSLSTETRRYVRFDINPKLMNNVMAKIRVLVPPLHEQRAIATFLDAETAQIDKLVTKIHEAIDRLREYRSALISAAATGKIDLREENT